MPTDNPDNGNQFESPDQQDYLAVNVYDTVTIENSIVNIFTPPSGYYDLPNYTRGRLAATAFRTRQADIWSYKYYLYDERGRVKTMWQMIDGLDVKTVSHEYNSHDMVKSLNYNIGADFKIYRYRYDNAGRLLALDTYEGPETTDDPTYYETFTDYSYNPNSAVETQNFLTGFTGTSLGYDNRGRIISYYSHNSEFIYNLTYLRNSNVLQQELYGSYRDYFANTEDLVYKFTYDKSNRLLSATNTAGSSNEYAVENTYDKDGNILSLKRYGDAGVLQDDFTYQFYSGTNKLRKVSGSADQYQYDLNGNVTTDSLNKNTSAVYDHRNLLIEIYHKRGIPPGRIDYFATRYYYDEAGNRVRKLTYKNNDANAGPVLDWNNTSNPGNSWTLFNNEHYARGVDGKDLATYTNNSLDEWYVWGTDMVGKIRANTKYYFFKDHLGSVRGVIDNNFTLVSAMDFDMWGYLMENRVYNGDSSKYKFTGKERDEENIYDYFGARYYDARVAKWGSVEPKLFKYVDRSPYSYSMDNSLNSIDKDGNDAVVTINGNNIKVEVKIFYTLGGEWGLDDGRNFLLESYIEEAKSLWNAVGNNIEFEGKKYNVQFEFESEYVSTESLQEINSNSQGANLAVGYEESVIGVKENFFYIGQFKNLKRKDYTGSHEMAHLFGLSHPENKEVSSDVMGYGKNRKPPRVRNVKQFLRMIDLDKGVQKIKGAKEKLGNSQGMRMTSETNFNGASSSFQDTISKTIHPIAYFDPSNLILNENSELFNGYMIFEVPKNKLFNKGIDSLFFICNIFWIKELCELNEINSRFLLTTPTLMYQIYIDKSWDEDTSNVTLAEFRSFYQEYKESVNNGTNEIPFLRNSLKTSIFREPTYFCSNSLSDSVGYFVFNVSFEAARLTMDLKYRNPLDSSELLNYFDAKVLIPISPEFYFFPTNKIFLTECELREATWFPDNLFLD